MNFEENKPFHVYNRSNNIVFKTRDNYIYFLNKFRKYILPFADVIAWCLMPDHFHFIIVPKITAAGYVKEKHLPNTQVLSKQFGILLSSYTKAFNKQNNRKGNLFSHNTKEKILYEFIYGNKKEYISTCFKYIQNNPVKSNLVKRHQDWEFNSFNDYAGLRKGNLVNKSLASDLINFDDDDFFAWSFIEINDEDIKVIF